MTRHLPQRALVVTATALLSASCLSSPPASPGGNAPPDPLPDAAAAIAMHVDARDASGATWDLDALPRRARLEVRGAWSPPERGAIFLFAGPPDAALLADLERPPVLVASLARAVPVDVETTPSGTRLVPRAPLALGAPLAVGVASWAVDSVGEPFGTPALVPVRVAAADAGAIVVETWPADGTYGVPSSIPYLAVRFDDAVAGIGAIEVGAEDGAGLAVSAELAPCDALRLAPGTCVRIVPDAPLPASTALALHVGPGVLDRTGAPVGPFIARFRTGAAGDVLPPLAPEPLPCALDETPAEGACVIGFDEHVLVRARFSGPALTSLTSGAETTHAAAPRGDVAFVVGGFSPGEVRDAELTVVGLDGSVASFVWSLSTEADLAPVFITEVRSDPAGPEPDQEYVEVHNASDAPIDLAGFRITDDASKPGDAIAGPAILPARGYALLVGVGFDPIGGDDDPVPPGIPLVRLDASIAGGGLTNEGEPLFLRDADGRRVSAAPALPAPAAGACIVRAIPDGRSGAPSAFAANATGGCGPGRADDAAGL